MKVSIRDELSRGVDMAVSIVIAGTFAVLAFTVLAGLVAGIIALVWAIVTTA